MKTTIKQKSLQKTITLVILTMTLIMGSMMAGLFAFFYSKYTRETVINNTDANLTFVVDSIDANLSSLTRLINFCQTHEYIGNYLTSNKTSRPQTSLKAIGRLDEEYKASMVKSHIHRIVVGNDNPHFLQIVDPSFSTSLNVSEITRELPFYESQLGVKQYDFSNGFIKDPYVRSFGTDVLIVIKPIYYTYSRHQIGYVAISLKDSFFTSVLNYYSLPDDSYLYLTLGEHVYSMTANGLIAVEDNNLTLKKLNDESYAVTKTLSDGIGTVSQTLSEKEISAYTPYYITILVSVVFFSFLLGIIVAVIMYNLINVPVEKLQNKIAKVSKGEFERDDQIEWEHELGDIGRGINDMSESINKLLNDRIQDEKDKKDLEYKMLQNQINPHFLYNTLNSIKWMAVTQGATGISEMTTALSRLLRNISKGTQTVITIEEEMSLVKDYFTIQQYRYGGSITLDIICDDDSVYNEKIVKFTLQPLVENAIFHGIEPKQSHGTISIHLFRDEDVYIVVKDDGIGIEEDKINQILNESSSDKSSLFKEIGIHNIQKRLQFEYGTDYGISIESVVGKYTEMIVKLPATALEEQNV